MRYTVRTNSILTPYRAAHLVAWVRDNQHGWPLSWHHEIADAARVCAALNAADQRDRAERALAKHANVMEF